MAVAGRGKDKPLSSGLSLSLAPKPVPRIREVNGGLIWGVICVFGRGYERVVGQSGPEQLLSPLLHPEPRHIVQRGPRHPRQLRPKHVSQNSDP